jgi:hypothetical protein
MRVSRFQMTDQGLEVANAVAAACGETFDLSAAGAKDGDFLTRVFRDVQKATAPRFDHINMAEFTRRRLAAWADADPDRRAFIHIDQYLDQWLLAATHLLGLRAYYNLKDENAKAVTALMAGTLNMAFSTEIQQGLREDMIPVFVDFPEALKVSHHMSMGSLVFIVCHELAHHAHDDLDQDPNHAVEYDADRAGLELMTSVYKSLAVFGVLKPSPLGFAGVWSLFMLWDLIERGSALFKKRVSRMPRETHPFASDRLTNLMPILGQFEDVRHMSEGLGPALDAYRQDLGVAHIT